MKKVLFFLLALSLILGLVGCTTVGGDESEDSILFTATIDRTNMSDRPEHWPEKSQLTWTIWHYRTGFAWVSIQTGLGEELTDRKVHDERFELVCIEYGMGVEKREDCGLNKK